MKQLNIKVLLLASLIVFMFVLAGISFAFRSYGAVLLCFAAGFIIMGLALYVKRRNGNHMNR